MTTLKERTRHLLRWSERYTKTDMLYLATSGFWMNANFLVTAALSLLLSVAFANFLSKAEYGLYQYVLAIGALMTAFTLTGMNSTITQSVARGNEGVLRRSIRIQLLWNLVPASAALALAGYYLFRGNMVLGCGVLFVSLSLPLLNAYNSYMPFLTGRKAFRAYALIGITGSAVYYSVMFTGVLLFPKAAPLLFLNLLVTTAIAFASYIYTLRRFKPNYQNDSKAFAYARHLTFMNVLSTAATNMDKLLVFHFLGPIQLAAYALAVLLPERLSGFFKPFLLAAFPRLTERGFSEIRATIFSRSLQIFAVTFLAAVLYAAISPAILTLLYPDYSEIIAYSQVYAFTFISVIGHYGTVALMAHKRVRELYILQAGIPTVHILMQIGGIYFWGLWGLIIAKVASAAMLSISALVLVVAARNPKA